MYNEKSISPVCLRFGNIRFLVSPVNPLIKFILPPDYSPFLANGAADVRISVRYGERPPVHTCEYLFDTNTIWSLYEQHGKKLLRAASHNSKKKPYRSALFSGDYKTGTLYVSPHRKKIPARPIPYPLGYPFDEILTINILARSRGLLVHAYGHIDDDLGCLFVGSSGAGKSTMANLWTSEKQVCKLSDDRIIIGRNGEEMTIYGTPWHGDAGVASPAFTALKKIFFIRHSNNNFCKDLKSMDAASRLLVCSFPTFWDKSGMEFTLRFIEEVVQKIPCYELVVRFQINIAIISTF